MQQTNGKTGTKSVLEKESLIANILPLSDDKVIYLQAIFILVEFAGALACGWLFFTQSVIVPTFQNLMLVVLPLILVYTAGNRYDLIREYRSNTAHNTNNGGESL